MAAPSSWLCATDGSVRVTAGPATAVACSLLSKSRSYPFESFGVRGLPPETCLTRSRSFFGVGLGAETKRINMKVQMMLEKRNDGLSIRNLEACLAAQDKDGSGSIDFAATENGLKAYK